jgi:hypothetical protein
LTVSFRKCLAAFCLLALLAGLPAAAEEPLATDRPDFTDSPLTVPEGRVQLEAGATYGELDAPEADVLSVGEILVRLGLAPEWELRIGVGSLVEVDTPRGDENGLSNAFLGAKWFSESASRAIGGDFGVLFGSSVPTGSDDVASDEWEPSVVAAAGWDLRGPYSLGVNAGYARPDGGGGDQFDQFLASASLGYTFTQRVAFFVEVYAFSEESEGGDATFYGDAGVTYLLGPNLQLDARLGTGLNDEANTDVFLGAGVSARF